MPTSSLCNQLASVVAFRIGFYACILILPLLVCSLRRLRAHGHGRPSGPCWRQAGDAAIDLAWMLRSFSDPSGDVDPLVLAKRLDHLAGLMHTWSGQPSRKEWMLRDRWVLDRLERACKLLEDADGILPSQTAHRLQLLCRTLEVNLMPTHRRESQYSSPLNLLGSHRRIGD